MKIFCNYNLAHGEQIEDRRGRNKDTIILLNGTNVDVKYNEPFQGKVSTISEKGIHTVYLRPSDENSDESRYVLFSTSSGGYRYHLVDPIRVFKTENNVGESTIAVLREGTLVEQRGYKGRGTPTFLFCDPDDGIVDIPEAKALLLLYEDKMEDL